MSYLATCCRRLLIDMFAGDGMVWSVSPNNHGRTCLASGDGGLPKTTPIWEVLKCAKYGVNWELCANAQQLFLCSAELLALSYDMQTGEKLWETCFPEEATFDIAIDKRHVCVAPYLMEQKTGSVISDLGKLGYAFRRVEDVEHGMFTLTTKGERNGVVEWSDAGCSFYPIDLVSVTSVTENELLVGYDKSGSLLCYSTEDDSIMWKLEKPLATESPVFVSSSGYMVVGEYIYQHLHYDVLRCIELQTGKVAWQSGFDSLTLAIDNGIPVTRDAPSRFLGCDDALYIGVDIDDNGYLQARSTEDGREIWRVDAPQARMFLIVGDLLFGALSDTPVAWDRHTGEVVWRAEKAMPPIFHAVAAGNKVIYTNTTSQMRCYEWTEPYRSPAAV